MILTIQNDQISLSVDTLGAQMMHIGKGGTEYLWQGDPKYWPDRALTLFPYIARLTNNSYRYQGTLYHMGIHGFAAASEFSVAEHTADTLVLALESNEETGAQYPFEFRFEIAYRLQGASIAVSYKVENRSSCTMPFGIGGHPGFNVPLSDGETFEDYTLEFSCPCQPDRVGFTPSVFLSGEDKAYPLQENRLLPLRHSLFDDDAIILKNMARSVTLRSKVSGRSVTVSYPDMPYLGIWHWPNTDAPYVCIEPWSSLPSRQDIVEELSCKSDLIHLHSGDTYHTTWTISLT